LKQDSAIGALSTALQPGALRVPLVSRIKFLGLPLLLCALHSGCAEEPEGPPPSLEFLRFTCVRQGDESSCSEYKARTGRAAESTPEEIQAAADASSKAAAQEQASAPARAEFEAEERAKEPSLPSKIGCVAVATTMATLTGGMMFDCHLHEMR
jgi:hypothetical protein